MKYFPWVMDAWYNLLITDNAWTVYAKNNTHIFKSLMLFIDYTGINFHLVWLISTVGNINFNDIWNYKNYMCRFS